MGGPQCGWAMDRLHEYVDRELSDTEMAEVQQHLEDCPPCGRHFHFQEQLKVLVYRKACPEKAPAHLVSRIIENIRRGGGTTAS